MVLAFLLIGIRRAEIMSLRRQQTAGKHSIFVIIRKQHLIFLYTNTKII